MNIWLENDCIYLKQSVRKMDDDKPCSFTEKKGGTADLITEEKNNSI